MKNFLIFLAVFISGIVGIFLIALIYTKTSSDPTTIQGITLFEEPGEIIDCQSVEVFQVVEKVMPWYSPDIAIFAYFSPMIIVITTTIKESNSLLESVSVR